MMQNYKCTFYILFLFLNYSIAQILPPIVKFDPRTYGAGNQNWMISQHEDRTIFIANNDGLLEFNGSNWRLYKSPNESIMRSVKVIGNRIYSGCYMEFGYWTRQPNGKLLYTSLSKTVKNKISNDEQFWNILSYDKWIIFQSLEKLFIYDQKTNQIKIIQPKNTILKSFETKNSIYFQTINDGLFEIENGLAKLVTKDDIIKNDKIINIFSDNNELIIQTQFKGLLKFVNGQFSKLIIKSDGDLASNNVYSCQKLQDGSFAIGTVSNGIYIVSVLGIVKYHITQSKGLSNNTVLSVFEDADNNLWAGLDNGINCINLQSNVKIFSDETGVLGTVYCATIFENKLYVGTNQGLFFKNNDSDENFQFVSGTKGQVWSLFLYQNELFCGHDSGTFVIKDENAKNIFSQSGTWKFAAHPTDLNKIIQGNYNGMSVLEKVGSEWTFKNKILGFNTSSKYFEIVDNLIFVSHEYKGIYRFSVDKSFQKSTNLYLYKNPIKGKNASLTSFNNKLYYANKNGIYIYNRQSTQFDKSNLLSKIFDKNQYTSGKMVLDNSNKLWLFSKDYIHYFTISKFSQSLKQNTIPIPASLTNSMLGYENIYQLTNYDYLIGTTDGFYTINIDDFNFKKYDVAITEIVFNDIDEKVQNVNLDSVGSFSKNFNNLNISYTVPEYNKFTNTEYQYYLDGFQEKWSDWSTKSNTFFKNLPAGNYIFMVKTRIANNVSSKIATYSFTIQSKWYATVLAKILYLIIFIIGVFYINKAYEKYYQRQKQKLIDENNRLLEFKELENEQELMKIRNEELSNDVDAKNRELAVSTMTLLKKNELLALIKEDLKKSSDETTGLSIKSVISTISRNITEDNTWNVFKEAFDNADKDFLKKAKAAHASLTPNDLRLCAYLRLNLSSKEIAPLLNISVRSVEIKRYRLRKKIDLTHEQGLVEYIMSI